MQAIRLTTLDSQQIRNAEEFGRFMDNLG